jgi:hypothetical protein
MTDAVEKVRGATPKRNNRIEPNNVLNLCCEYGSSLESMLRGKTHKILFRQYRPIADIHPSVRRSTSASNRSLAFLKSGMVEYVACAPNLVQFRRPPVLLVQGAACRCDGPHAKATTTQKISCRLGAPNRHKPRRCICGWASRNRRPARCYDVSAGLNDRH